MLSTSKTKVLSAEIPIASSKLSRLKDLAKVHAYSFPTHAYGNQGRRRKGSAELDVVLGQILVTQLWEVNTDLTVEVLLKYSYLLHKKLTEFSQTELPTYKKD